MRYLFFFILLSGLSKTPLGQASHFSLFNDASWLQETAKFVLRTTEIHLDSYQSFQLYHPDYKEEPGSKKHLHQPVGIKNKDIRILPGNIDIMRLAIWIRMSLNKQERSLLFALSCLNPSAIHEDLVLSWGKKNVMSKLLNRLNGDFIRWDKKAKKITFKPNERGILHERIAPIFSGTLLKKCVICLDSPEEKKELWRSFIPHIAPLWNHMMQSKRCISNSFGYAMDILGIGFETIKEYSTATTCYEHALSIYDKLKKEDRLEDSKDISYLLKNLARLYQATHKYKQALVYFQRLIKIKKIENKEKAFYFYQIGVVYEKLEMYKEAMLAYSSSFQMIHPTINDDDIVSSVVKVLNSFHHLYQAYQKQKKINSLSLNQNPSHLLIQHTNKKEEHDILDSFFSTLYLLKEQRKHPELTRAVADFCQKEEMVGGDLFIQQVKRCFAIEKEDQPKEMHQWQVEKSKKSPKNISSRVPYQVTYSIEEEEKHEYS